MAFSMCCPYNLLAGTSKNGRFFYMNSARSWPISIVPWMFVPWAQSPLNMWILIWDWWVDRELLRGQVDQLWHTAFQSVCWTDMNCSVFIPDSRWALNMLYDVILHRICVFTLDFTTPLKFLIKIFSLCWLIFGNPSRCKCDHVVVPEFHSNLTGWLITTSKS